MRTSGIAAGNEAGHARDRPPGGLIVTPELIDEYIQYMEAKGRTLDTRAKYRRSLELMCEYLPESRRVERGTMEAVRQKLVEAGYAPRTINSCLSAANGLMKWCDKREFMLPDRLTEAEAITPELTRNEYLRVLMTAKALEREREYLIIKVFATMGIALSELELVTVEALERGVLEGEDRAIRFPKGLRQELREYARRDGRLKGSIFTGANGKPIPRTMVTYLTQSLCEEARVEKEKLSPRCLRKLYRTTQEGIERSLAIIVEQSYERLLEKEQLTVGWDR